MGMDLAMISGCFRLRLVKMMRQTKKMEAMGFGGSFPYGVSAREEVEGPNRWIAERLLSLSRTRQDVSKVCHPERAICENVCIEGNLQKWQKKWIREELHNELLFLFRLLLLPFCLPF